MKKKIVLAVLAFAAINMAVAQLTGPLEITGAQSNFAQYLRMSSVESTTNSSGNPVTEAFNNTENTSGKRFLFDTWAKGSNVIDAQNRLVNTSTYLFNYDLLTGSLLVSENRKDVMSVTSSGIKVFTLENKGKQYPFVHTPLIDSTRFYLKLAGSDSLYSLYKECRVKFVKSNYRDDGLIKTGNPNDEYIDNSQYYIIKPNESTSRLVSLKPNDMKNVLVAHKEKVSSYFRQHKEDDINEAFLVGLVNYINQ